MGIINRFILFLYTLFFAVLSLGVGALVLQVVPEHAVWNEFQYASAQWQTGAAAAVLFLLSIHLLGCSFASSGKGREEREVILVHAETGDVRVAVEAVRNMVDKIARTMPGVRDVNVKAASVRKKENEASVRIVLKLVLGQEANVAAVSDRLRAEIGRQLEETVGIADFSLEISVADISNAPLARKQRVV